MSEMIKIELKRAFFSKNYLFSIVVGFFITGSQIFMWVLPAEKLLDNYLAGKGEYPVSLFNTWIGASGHTFQLTLFYMVLPVLACIPFADSCFVEKESGYCINILTRCKKTKFYIAKCIAVYLSGGMAVIVPLFVNLLITAMLIPAIIPEASSRTFPLFEHSMWSDVFYSHPFYYLEAYFILIFLYAGLFALWGIVVSFYLRNRYLVLLFPFMIYTVFGFVVDYMGKYQYSPAMFLRPDQPAGANFLYIVLFYTGMLATGIVILVYKWKRDEVL